MDIGKVLNRLRNYVNTVAGVEGYDTFALFMNPRAMEEMDVVLKAQGLYKDRELYNYECGTFYGNGLNWTGKHLPSGTQYTAGQLDKLRLSYPCFYCIIPSVRRKIRKIKPDISSLSAFIRQAGDQAVKVQRWYRNFYTRPVKGIHFLGSLTHSARVRFLKGLRENNIPGLYGITGINPHFWGGMEVFGNISREVPVLREWLEKEGLQARLLNRMQFRNSLLHYQVVAAPNGFGELSFRHAEALEAKRLLLCQDLDHVETMFPFQNNKNAVFCQPDFSDLIEVVKKIEEAGAAFYRAVAEKGKEDWGRTEKNIDSLLFKGLLQHLK